MTTEAITEAIFADQFVPDYHGLKYSPVQGNVFHGVECVILSTWSLEGPQPLLLTYSKVVQHRAELCRVHSDFGNNLVIVSEKQAWLIAAGMSVHVGGEKPNRRNQRQSENKALVVAALFVLADGPYADLTDVEVWHKERDARRYSGPHPVVAHPPCERWGRYWSGGPSTGVRRKLGDDDGCFQSALNSVRAYGGVLEHPEASHAWKAFGLTAPPRSGGWIDAGDFIGWTCCVEQGNYGHMARKATWLYSAHCELPSLKWGNAPGDFVRMDGGFHSAEERRRSVGTGGACQRLSKRQRAATPVPFRDVLIGIARSKI